MDDTLDTSVLGSGRRFDVKFTTRDERYSIPDTPFQLAGGSKTEHFNQVVNSILFESSQDPQDRSDVEFDFLVDGQILRLSLEEHLEEVAASKGDVVNAEREIVIDYFVRQSAPQPQDSLLHDDWISSVASNETGYLLSGCYDGTVHIWTIREGKHILAIPAHQNPVKAVAWMDTSSLNEPGTEDMIESGDLIFTSGSHDETLKIWKWSPSKSKKKVICLFVCVGHVRSVDCIDVNMDLIASGSFDKLLKVWSFVSDVESEKKVGKIMNKRQKGNDGEVKDVSKAGPQNKTPLLTLSGHKEAITGVTWLSDRNSSSTAPELLTCSMDNTMRVWDIEVSEVKQTFTGSKAFLNVSYSSTHNCILSASTDRHVRLWDTRTSQVSTSFSSHTGWVSSVSWSSSNPYLFVSGSYDNQVKYWDTRLPKASLYDLMGHKDKVLCVNWNNREYIVSGSSDNQVKVFQQK